MLKRGLAWGTRTLLVALVAAAAWSLLASWQHDGGSGPGALTGLSLLAVGEQGDVIAAATAPLVVVAVLGAFALVCAAAAASVEGGTDAPLRARAPPSR